MRGSNGNGIWCRKRAGNTNTSQHGIGQPTSITIRKAKAAQLVASNQGRFAALLVKKDEVSLTVSHDVWSRARNKVNVLPIHGPYRVLTLDLAIDLGLSGYLLPAVERLAEAEISEDAEKAASILEQFIREGINEEKASLGR